MHNTKIPTAVGRKNRAGQRLVRTLMVGALMGGVCLGHVAPVMAQTTTPGQTNPTIDEWKKTGRTIAEPGPDGSTNIYDEIKNTRTGQLGKEFRENVPAETAPEPETPPAPGPGRGGPILVAD